MIYLVVGFKRTGTSLVMHLLKKMGIPLYYDLKNEKDHTVPNPYFYESEFTHYGFKEKDVPKLEGKALKLISHALSLIPLKGDYKIIHTKRNWKNIEKSLAGKVKYGMKVEKDAYDSGESPGFFGYFDNIIDIHYDDLIDEPDRVLKELMDFLEIKVDINILKKEIKPNMRHHQ